MRISQIVAWYQKKIGSYDKQEWEKTLEQKILLSALSLPLKSTKLKTDLIDVDLVRGSTFPKAKPKQSLVQVFYLSILRSLLLPLYAKWFLRTTSPKIFLLLLLLYLSQLINWAIYSLNINKIETKTSKNGSGVDEEDPVVVLSELLIPMGLSMLLCFIHSQIVATSSNSTRTSSQRKNNLNNCNKKNADKLKRRKKMFRRPNSKKGQSSGSDEARKSNQKSNQNEQSQNVVITDKNKLDLQEIQEEKEVPVKLEVKLSSLKTSPNLRKRNVSVNWDSPIRSHLVEEFERLQREEGENVGENPPNKNPVEDDGFESYNTGKSSSGEDNNNVLLRVFQNKLLNSEESDTDTLKNSERSTPVKISKNSGKTPVNLGKSPAKSPLKLKEKESSDTDEENNDDVETLSPNSSTHQFTEPEYIGQTTNSDYSSELDQSDNGDDLEFDGIPTTILNPNQDSSERVSCTIWTKQHEAKKAEMSVLDIASHIIERVEGIPDTCDYVYIGLILSLLLSLTPSYCRMCERAVVDSSNSTEIPKMLLEIPRALWMDQNTYSYYNLMDFAFGKANWEKTILVLSFAQRLVLTSLFFFLLAVAERTFKQRFLYAKLFSHLTSSRRARKSDIPHFRLNKVKHIKAWLSVRSYLKRLGPQRSVDIIVSASFITTLFLLAFLSLEFLKDSEPIHSLNLEALMWSCSLGSFLLRFMTLGTKINRKYRSVSVLITEQINLYVQIELKPQKKEELMISNSVLKLAADLLKELESPFKISGLSANSYLYNTVKVVILSALSGVLSEMLGFKLKLHKIKIK